MRNQLSLLAVFIGCAALGYLRSPSLAAVSQDPHLSINRVGLGMTRAEVDHLFGGEKRGHRSAEESFGMGPGAAGFGDGTGVTFDSSALNARVVNASGAYLYYDGVLLCGELSPRPPDNRSALIKQKLGDPDRVIHEREGVLWVYDRYQLTIDTHPKFAWYFRLGSGEWN